MCVVSMVGEYYEDKWKIQPFVTGTNWSNWATSAEVAALRKEVEEMKELLRRAKLYDEQNGEPNCEMEDKVALIRKVADLVGVDLQDLI